MIYKLLIDLGISFLLSLVWAHIFTMILKFTASKKAIGCVLPTFVVRGGMMSFPVWSHVLSRGYDVTSCLVPYSFQGCVWSQRGCLVPGEFWSQGGSGPGGSGPREGLVKGGYLLPLRPDNICKNITFPPLRWRAVKIVSDGNERQSSSCPGGNSLLRFRRSYSLCWSIIIVN